MKLKNSLMFYLIVLALLDMVIPIPFTAILLIYVLVEKPPWFQKWVDSIYRS